MSGPYAKLAIATSVNAVMMFFITYAMLASGAHFYANLNRFYMAAMMAAPMVIVMLLVMRQMFGNSRLNHALMGLMGGLFLVVLGLARTQTPIRERQFLRSMIPHHSSAILMCREASITDAEVTRLCRQIVASQEAEIAEMKRLLSRY